jgi:hypothetical protein
MHVKITLKNSHNRGQLLNLKFFKYNNQRKSKERKTIRTSNKSQIILPNEIVTQIWDHRFVIWHQSAFADKISNDVDNLKYSCI